MTMAGELRYMWFQASDKRRHVMADANIELTKEPWTLCGRLVCLWSILGRGTNCKECAREAERLGVEPFYYREDEVVDE